MRTILRLLPALALAIAFAAPQMASASPTFYGIVKHVSVNNIKVQNPKTHETLSFLILPKFNQVFSDDGKTTYQMTNIHPGQYVRVTFDQKALGIRHADRIVVLTKQNRGILKQ
ncbi:MAG: hypothetical protein M3Z07_03685 [Candidatus Eremiobacteraeota bacterium]|nr:hypothetical protein [Candidatus Eremiobacteraeota bacterium]